MTATVRQYRTAQDKVTRSAVGPLIALMHAVPVGTPMTDAQWQRLLATMLPRLVRGRAMSRDLAADMYAVVAPSKKAPDIGPRPYDASALGNALTRGFEKNTGLSVREKLADLDRHAQGVVEGASVVARHVEMAGRDYQRQASFADEDALGWARVARGARTCAFCLMLISRGPCYTSAATAGFNDDGTMNQWHLRCDCQAVPVHDLTDWPGVEQFRQAEQVWADSTGDYSGVGKLNAFRRAIENRSPDDRAPDPVAEVAKANDPGRHPGDMDADELSDAMQSAIEAEDWDRFDALSLEADYRDDLKAREDADTADRAAASAARSERRRRQKARERESRLDLMTELIEQGVPEEEAYAQAYDTTTDDFARRRAIDQLRTDGYKGSSFEKLARASYKDYVYRQWSLAETACRGTLLNKAAEARKVDDRSLFSGPYSYAVKHASEELLDWWEANGRLTFEEWQAQLLGDVTTARQANVSGRVIRG